MRHIVRFVLGVFFVLGLGLPAKAESISMRKPLSADEAKTWQAVGRINMQDAGFCTGSLIAPDLVLTAAHCVYHPKTGVLIKPKHIKFLAGWRSGHAAAERQAYRVIVHKDYEAGRDVQLDKVASDIALIELADPIDTFHIEALSYQGRPHVGESVKIVSYAQDHAEVPSIEEPCHVLDQDPRALILTCSVDHGSSGAPVFVTIDGKPKIASIVSAKAMLDGQSVALGAVLGSTLQEMLLSFRTQQSALFVRNTE